MEHSPAGTALQTAMRPKELLMGGGPRRGENSSMKTRSKARGISRRDFVKNTAAVGAFAAAGLAALRAAEKPKARKMMGVQVGSL